jgi:hypothetical protein
MSFCSLSHLAVLQPYWIFYLVCIVVYYYMSLYIKNSGSNWKSLFVKV